MARESPNDEDGRAGHSGLTERPILLEYPLLPPAEVTPKLTTCQHSNLSVRNSNVVIYLLYHTVIWYSSTESRKRGSYCTLMALVGPAVGGGDEAAEMSRQYEIFYCLEYAPALFVMPCGSFG